MVERIESSDLTSEAYTNWRCQNTAHPWWVTSLNWHSCIKICSHWNMLFMMENSTTLPPREKWNRAYWIFQGDMKWIIAFLVQIRREMKQNWFEMHLANSLVDKLCRVPASFESSRHRNWKVALRTPIESANERDLAKRMDGVATQHTRRRIRRGTFSWQTPAQWICQPELPQCGVW